MHGQQTCDIRVADDMHERLCGILDLGKVDITQSAGVFQQGCFHEPIS